MKRKELYESPTIKLTGVVEEQCIAQTTVSVQVTLSDWEDGGTIGDDADEGGDISLIY